MEQAIFEEVLPRFMNIDERADAAGHQYYEDANRAAAGYENYCDSGEIAESAMNHAYATFDALSDIRQMMLNLLATCLFHSIEQQLAIACQTELPPGRPVVEADMDEIATWFNRCRGIQIKSLAEYSRIGELKLLANAVKHAAGGAADKLRRVKPSLFRYPGLPAESPSHRSRPLPIKEPLAGGDLYVTAEALREYCDAAIAFVEAIATKLETVGDA